MKRVTSGQVAEHVPGQLVDPFVVDLPLSFQLAAANAPHLSKLSGHLQLFHKSAAHNGNGGSADTSLAVEDG